MQAVNASVSRRDVIFTANTGHELGHTGLDLFLEKNPKLIKEAHVWMHLGANFAAQFGVRRQTLWDHWGLFLRDTFLPIASPV